MNPDAYNTQISRLASGLTNIQALDPCLQGLVNSSDVPLPDGEPDFRELVKGMQVPVKRGRYGFWKKLVNNEMGEDNREKKEKKGCLLVWVFVFLVL